MKVFSIVIVLTMFIFGCTTPPTQKQLDAADYGAYPDSYKEIIKNYLDRSLKDPESAKIEYIFSPRTAWNKLGGDLKFGYSVCVNVNAKNSYGGYTGFQRHYFLIKNGSVIQTIHERDKYDSGILNAACQN